MWAANGPGALARSERGQGRRGVRGVRGASDAAASGRAVHGNVARVPLQASHKDRGTRGAIEQARQRCAARSVSRAPRLQARTVLSGFKPLKYQRHRHAPESARRAQTPHPTAPRPRLAEAHRKQRREQGIRDRIFTGVRASSSSNKLSPNNVACISGEMHREDMINQRRADDTRPASA